MSSTTEAALIIYTSRGIRGTETHAGPVGVRLLRLDFPFCLPGRLEAAENLRAASGGFTTAIHAVLWAANEEKIFRKYGLNVEYLTLNTGRLGMQKFYRF